jgi:hypothetical protein
MFSQFKQAACLLLFGVVGILGCSQGNAAKSTAPPSPLQLLNSDVPQTPEAAVKAVQDGLKASKPVVVWDAMTATNQANYNKIVRDYATAIDPEIWKRTVANLTKLVRLAETKKEFILASPLLKSSKQIPLDDLKAHWSPGLNLLKTIVQSELVDQEKMKNFDGRAFLEGTGAKLYAQARELTKSMKDDPLKRIDELKARVVTSTDQNATVTLESSDPKAEPIEIPLVVQEGKWTTDRFQFLPFLAVSKLNPIMSHFRPYELVEWKDDYLADMQRIDKILDQLQAAKTSDDFQAVVSLRVLPYVLQKTVQLNQKPKAWSGLRATSQARPKATAMVVIKGEHFPDEPAMLDLLKVFRTVEASGNGLLTGPLTVDGSTVFLVSPVTDTEAFSKKFQVGKITKIDVKRNTVSLDLPGSAADEKATANADGAAKSTAH